MLIYDAILDAPPCRLGAVFTGDALTRLDFLPANTPDSGKYDNRVRHLAERTRRLLAQSRA